MTKLDSITGLVERISEKGTAVKVNGEWCTASQYATPPIEIPKLGQRVALDVERTGRGIWIHSAEVLDDGRIYPLPQQQRRGGTGGRSPAEQRDIRRLSVLKAAAAFGASRADMKSADVVKVADA